MFTIVDMFTIFGSTVGKSSGCVGVSGGRGISLMVSMEDGSGRKVGVKNSFVARCCNVVVVLLVFLRVVFDFQKELNGQDKDQPTSKPYHPQTYRLDQ